MTKYLLTIGFMASALLGISQDVSQLVKGDVIDGVSNQPLADASIDLSNEDYRQGTITDQSGHFEIADVPPGRYRVQISFTGYTTYIDELLVISGKENRLSIRLVESSTVLTEVEVATASSSYIPGVEAVSIEKTMRIPANFFDPVRMVTSYPGVVAASDQGNSIIVKGNSPNGLLWRLNGLDIVNPNHLANAGTLSDKPMANGGGVNIMSAQMLDQTSFYSGAFPASYGNALSGIFDMKLREGNSDEAEYTAQASLIGLDLSAEGPLSKKHNSSFLINYRYSTVGLLSKLGVQFGDEEINFQDFSFHLNFDQKNGGKFSVFGFAGNSRNEFARKDSTEWEEDKEKYNILYRAYTYGTGVNYTTPIGVGNLFVGLAYSLSDQTREAANVQGQIPADYQLVADDYQSTHAVLSSNIKYETKTGAKSSLQVGVMTNFQNDQLDFSKVFGCATCPYFAKSTDGEANGVLLQPYVNWNTSLVEKLQVNLGVRYLHYTYTNSSSFEPRVSLSYESTVLSSVVLSYGIVSQQQLPGTYFEEGNQDLGLTKAHHVELGYRIYLSGSLKLKTELYYQNLFDVPIEDIGTSTFSTINLLETTVPKNLVNKGTGENYGLNVTLEKSFFRSHYFLVGGSYYESTYTGGDNVKRDTRFNGNYTVNAVYGIEWNRKKNKTIGLNTRMLYLGGLRESNVDVPASIAGGESIYSSTDPYSNTLSDYFRLDLRVSFRKNKPGYTRIFAIDIQNLTGQQNEAYHYYDFVQQKTVTKYQLGLIPVLVYRIDF